MPVNQFMDISLSGSATVVPPKGRSIEEDVDLFGGNIRQIERLKKTLGLNERRIASNELTNLDLCEQAAQVLLEQLNIQSSDLDGIIYVTQTPDHLQPSNAALLHGRLACSTECAALDIGLGCSGFVYALWLAYSIIANGSSQRVLVLAGDTLSRLVHPKDRATASLFGDAGSATMVEKRSEAGASWFRLGTDGRGADSLIVPAGGARLPFSEETAVETSDADGNIRTKENLFMDGSEVFNFSIEVVPREIEALLSDAGASKDAVDYFVLHQANRYMVHNIGKRLRVDLERCPVDSFGAFGNVSSASIPGALAYELADSLSGECEGKSSHQVVLSGFGVGLSWGTCLLNIPHLGCLEWRTYKA